MESRDEEKRKGQSVRGTKSLESGETVKEIPWGKCTPIYTPFGINIQCYLALMWYPASQNISERVMILHDQQC